jgi:DNA-binding HxlR family transcriptional regulator
MPISAQKKRGLTARKSPKKGGSAALRMRARGGYRRPRKIFERNCSVGRTVGILCNSWSFLILRECLFGGRRFQTFQSILGLPRQTLAIRLKQLTSQGLLRQAQYSERPQRSEYRLTEMGMDLYPVFLALLNFGDKWLAGKSGPPLQLFHRSCGRACTPVVACSHCGKGVDAAHATYRDGPGAGTSPLNRTKRNRRQSEHTLLERRRPCSVARSLKIIGDYWSFMVNREAFFGVRRFDEIQNKLGIAPTILTDRLGRLVSEGILAKKKYLDLPERFEYRLTAMGKDLYLPLIAMLRWGDRWLSGDAPPLILTHTICGHDFDPAVICNKCGKPVEARAMTYKLHYKNPMA